jgi:hypothetical protein
LNARPAFAAAVADNRSARGGPELHALAGHPIQRASARSREELEDDSVRRRDVLRIAGSATQRNGPLPSQNRGRTYFGTKP